MKKGVLFAIAAYMIWGFIPLYFKLLVAIPPILILLHRIIWSFVLLFLLTLIVKNTSAWREVLKWSVIRMYLLAAGLIGVNWFVYVWGVNNGFIIETSLGYFINPLVSILLGMLVFKEIPRPLQWLAVLLAVIGVTYFTLSIGSLPWISLVLAFSFGLYGLVKKVAPLPPLTGLTIETGLLLIPAIVGVILLPMPASPESTPSRFSTMLLLIGTGLATATPLLLFSSAAPKIPLQLIGMLQYIAPTLQFLIGVYIYAEPFSTDKLIGFGFIWLALIIFTAEGWITRRRSLA